MMDWNEKISGLPGASILQTSQWADIKSPIGWEPLYKDWQDDKGQTVAAALILKRKAALNQSFLYCPHGPMLDWNDIPLRTRVLDDLKTITAEQKAIFIKIDPDVPYAFGIPGSEDYQPQPSGQGLLEEYQQRGWVFSPQQIQFANTVWIDLKPDEDTLLANMKQGTRRKVRLAGRDGVEIRHGDPNDFRLLYAMYHETAARDNFIIREEDYYLSVWQTFYDAGMLTPLIAHIGEDDIAAIMLFTFAGRAWYIYGMSRDMHRKAMPNYLLQWEAICTAKDKGCRVYDLWGAPDVFSEEDRMWGVFRFKEGLGGKTVLTPGAYDLPVNRPLYRAFVHAMPKVTGLLRSIRSSRDS